MKRFSTAQDRAIARKQKAARNKFEAKCLAREQKSEIDELKVNLAMMENALVTHTDIYQPKDIEAIEKEIADYKAQIAALTA